MATKVNRDYWSGTIYNMSGFPNADDIGYLDGSLYELIDNDKWNIANNDEFDLSVCPWGMPQCSLSSLATPVFAKDEGNKVILSFQESNRRNMPLFFNRVSGRVNTDSYNTTTSRNDNKQRVVGDTAKATGSGYLRYTTTIDTQNVTPTCIGNGTKPIVSLNYSSVRAWLGAIWYFDTLKYDNFSNVGFTCNDIYDFLALKDSDATKWRYKLVRCGFAISSKLNSNTRVNAHICGKTNIPEYLQTQYYNEGTTEYIDLSREIRIIGQNVGTYPGYGNYGYTYLTGESSPYSNTVPTLKTTKSTEYGCGANSTCICNASAKRQKFDDVSYHWEQHLYYYTTGTSGSGVRLELKNGEPLPFNTSKYVNPILTLEIDSTIYDNYYDSAVAALMHEAAFLGLPFCKSFDDINNSLSDTTCFIPVFDYEHMITTGEYKRGDEATDLPNFTWGDIFDTSVPAYDPNYIPPEPEPEDGDTGNRNNSVYRGIYATGSNRFFALSQTELINFINFVNNMYVTDPDPDAAETQLKIDYKGSNPNDYIVGIYAVPIPLEYVSSTENIYLGPVQTSVAANRIEVQSEGAFSWGYYDIPEYYGDFRDYEPYTQIELYIPLCGSVKLDPAEYIGHRVVVDAIWDIQTGELTARVLRDGITITHTLQGSIAVQVPICARDMGSYQNNLHQIRMSLISAGLSSLSSTKSQAFSDINSVAQIAGTKAGKTPSVGNITSGINPFNVAENAANTALAVYDNMYTLGHMQPQLYITGSASSANAINMERRAFIFIKRCRMLANYNAAEYSHIVGNACCISGEISSFSGFTVAATANLDGIQTKSELSPLPATEEEKQMIKKLLQTGVYI